MSQRVAGVERLGPPALSVLASLASLLAAGCAAVPGAVEGGPCNSKGICSTGLICDEGTCKSTETATSSWELMRTPFDSKLNAVWGRGEGDVYAVGDAGRILRYRGEGLDWREERHGLDVSANLHAIWGRGSEVWVGGAGRLLRASGASWVEQSAYDTAQAKDLAASFVIYGISGTAEGIEPPWAVGSTSGSYGDGLVLRLVGQRWETVDAGLSFVGRGAWASSDEVFVVGEAKHVKRYDGQAWTEENLAEKVALAAIWGAGDGTLLAVGPPSWIFERDSGATPGWTLEVSRASSAARGVWGTSADRYFVVGAGGYGGYSDTSSSIESCDGVHVCSPNVLPEEARGKQLNGIWGDTSALYAVGDSGIILRRRTP